MSVRAETAPPPIGSEAAEVPARVTRRVAWPLWLITAGTAPAPGKPYFAYGSVVAGGWILGNPSLNGYQGFTAQHRDPSLTIVVWSTAAKGNPETSNASQTISKRIAAVLSDDPITL